MTAKEESINMSKRHALQKMLGIGAMMALPTNPPLPDPGSVGPLAALKQAAAGVPDRHIIYAVADDITGSPIPASLFSHAGHPGLVRENGYGQEAGVDPKLDFTKKNGHALPPGSSFTWRGTLEIPKTGMYWIYLQLMGCAAQLNIDGKLVGRSSGLFLHGDYIQAAEDNVLPTTDNLDDVRRTVHLAAGTHSLLVTEQGDGSSRPVQIRLNWMTPRERPGEGSFLHLLCSSGLPTASALAIARTHRRNRNGFATSSSERPCRAPAGASMMD